MSSGPLVTVVMPVRNGALTLDRSIQSILAQTYTHWELLILDDGSTDDSLLVAQRFKDNRVQIWSDKQQRGIVARLNQGIALARGQYIARMDADDYAYPQRLQKQIIFLEKHPEIDLVGTAIRLLSALELPQKCYFPLYHQEIVGQPWKKTLSVAHPTWCGRTDWFRQWQYRPFIRNEDQELLLRASHSSIYANLPEVLLDYSHKPSWRKSLSARIGWARVLWVHYARRRHLRVWAIGMMILVFKVLKDVFFLKSTGIFETK